MDASATRSSTTVSGGTSRSTTPLKKNEPPHRIERTPSSDQSRASIRSSWAVIAVISAFDAGIIRRIRLAHPIPGHDFESPLFRARDDLDHLAFVVIGRVGL